MATNESIIEFDIALFGAEANQECIEKLEELLEMFVHIEGKAINVVTVEDFKELQDDTERTEAMIKKSFVYGLYVTSEFCVDLKAKQAKGESIAKTTKSKDRVVVPMYSVLSSDKEFEEAGLVGLKGVSVPLMLNLKVLKDVDVKTLTEKDVNMKILNQIKKLVEKKRNVKKQWVFNI